jgi:nicotinamidase-related amidase
VLIDYQKEMFEVIRSETSADLVDLNVRLLAKAAKAFDMPIVLLRGRHRDHTDRSSRPPNAGQESPERDVDGRREAKSPSHTASGLFE